MGDEGKAHSGSREGRRLALGASLTTVLSFDVRKRSVVAGGHAFGAVGPYEHIDARALLAVDPLAPEQAAVVDVAHAPRDDAGRVRFETDVQILMPVDAERANRRLFVELVNRGNKRCLQFFNDAPASNDPHAVQHFGNGFLMRRGYVVCWIAWQGDILPGDRRIEMKLPVAAGKGGPIAGAIRSEFIATSASTTTFPLSGWASTRSHPAVSLDTAKASLVRRRYPD